MGIRAGCSQPHAKPSGCEGIGSRRVTGCSCCWSQLVCGYLAWATFAKRDGWRAAASRISLQTAAPFWFLRPRTCRQVKPPLLPVPLRFCTRSLNWLAMCDLRSQLHSQLHRLYVLHQLNRMCFFFFLSGARASADCPDDASSNEIECCRRKMTGATSERVLGSLRSFLEAASVSIQFSRSRRAQYPELFF